MTLNDAIPTSIKGCLPSTHEVQPILFFADRLPPLVGGVEMHARYFIEHFQNSTSHPLIGIVTRDEMQRDCLVRQGQRLPVIDFDFMRSLPCTPSIVFFNSGRWIEDLPRIREVFPRALFVYRTGGNEILKAPLERERIGNHHGRQAFWVEHLRACIDMLITNSAFTEDRLAELGLPRTVFARVVGGVSGGALRSSITTPRKPHGIITLFCAARFVPYKNHALLCEVAAILAHRGHHFRLELAGDGPLLEKTREYTSRLGIADQVDFLGALPNDDVCTCIAAADFYVQFSVDLKTEVSGGAYVHAEGMGRSILEALSCGTFVVAIRSGALAEIVTPDRGVLLDLAPAETIADQFEEFLRVPPKRAPFFDGYDWGRVFARYEERWEASSCARSS